MTDAPRLHDRKVSSLLEAVEADRAVVLKSAAQFIGTAGASMFPLDIMAIGAVKRSVSTAASFTKMIET
jgi:hypothetical protein